MFEYIRGYRVNQFGADVLAGVMAAVVLIPQGMAYALLAGLSPQFGLYACLAPLILYGVFGSSTSLSVGPAALISLMVYSGVSQIATPGTERYILLCGTTALLAGVIKIAMAFFRLGFITNFISVPVLVGFTNAGAVIIIFSQLKHWLGVPIEQGEYPLIWMIETVVQWPKANPMAMGLGLTSCAVLWIVALSCRGMSGMGRSTSPATSWLAKLSPLIVVVATTVWVAWARLDETAQLRIIGEVPRGLPGWHWPRLDPNTLRGLFPVALAVTLVGYIQSMSLALTLASRKRQRINPDRELFALGMADVGAALTQGYPVAGSFGGSAVREAAGSQTPLASIVSALAIAVALLGLTPYFYFIPQTVLASIVIVSVFSLIDFRLPIQLWRYSRNDAVTLWLTFLAVILLGVETGIVFGVAATFGSWLWRTSRPQIVEVGRIPGSESFRDVSRYQVETVPGVLALRLDESLYFANARFLHEFILEQVAERRDLRAVLLIASGMNRIDATGIEALKLILEDLNRAGVRFAMSDVKWAVSDRLQRSGFSPEFLRQSLFLSADVAMQSLAQAPAPNESKPAEEVPTTSH